MQIQKCLHKSENFDIMIFLNADFQSSFIDFFTHLAIFTTQKNKLLKINTKILLNFCRKEQTQSFNLVDSRFPIDDQHSLVAKNFVKFLLPSRFHQFWI